jgi:hypothetical protein
MSITAEARVTSSTMSPLDATWQEVTNTSFNLITSKSFFLWANTKSPGFALLAHEPDRPPLPGAAVGQQISGR